MRRTVSLRRRRLLPLLGGLLALLVGVTPASAAAGWTAPSQIGTATGCSEVSAGIDADGGQHVAAECATNIRYLTDQSGSWTQATFSHPAGQMDLAPQIAIDGDRLYIAFTRAAPATCGLDYIGVYYRWRTLPGGAWSSAIGLGSAGDRLHSFRVVDGDFHATVMDDGGAVRYETTASGTLKRYVLPGAIGLSSLRVGSDGGARIVYETAGLLRFAVFHGSGFDWSSIPGTGPNDRRPLLVLDADNRAHVIWTHTGGPGCGTDEPTSLDGTYYATNRSGQWTAPGGRRFTRNTGIASLTMDPGSGRLHVLTGGDLGIKHYTKSATGTWGGTTLSTQIGTSVAIRLNGETGRLLGVYARLEPDFDLGGVYVLTKP